MPRLKAFVHVAGSVYGPGDEVPAEVARLITNPKAWEGGVPPVFDDETGGDGQSGDASVEVAEPPRSGAGSGRPAWAEYAASLGLEVPADASRDDIIAAVDKAK
jgi:hypothetical protein